MEAINVIGTSTAETVANYILKHYGPMSHLKLQKLLFYTQAYHLAYFDKPLFAEDFQAWIHGPVCREVYDSQKGNSLLYGDIGFNTATEKDPDGEIAQVLSSSQKELLVDVLGELSQWTGLELEASTHKEEPWISARKGFTPADRCENVISKESMRAFYKSELNG